MPPQPLHLLRDGANHWLSNPVESPAGPYIISNQEDLFRLVYTPMAFRRGVTPKPPTERQPASTDPLPVQVNMNRWVVQCPDCGGAEYAWPEDPWFLCGSCFNASVAGLWRPVVWPGDDEVTAVEETLLARPIPFNRNWNPFREDADDLKAQNAQNGDPPGLTIDQPPRIKRNRPQADKTGTRWRRFVKKQAQVVQRMSLPPGWDEVPLVVAVPEGASQSDGILYPDVPLPPESGLGENPRGV